MDALRNLFAVVVFVALAAYGAYWVNEHSQLKPESTPTVIVNTNSPVGASGP